ncbi:hypothetical protein BV20DRAFT_1033355 [Pilatotrama ljubarskyi]|nr:hypothetical protein BV20DRAFT_1033355 [Pilatotrama ljubarskyi]
MWCTRWYLPLLLLPFPIASPFYLMLWIFSISMHARPCFYCMALLSTMYISLCYWPPVPIDTPLVRPWSQNITTFADALRYKMPDLPQEKFPDMIPIEEHCWCDVSSGAFVPVNLTKWEEASVNRLVDNLEKDIAAERAAARRRLCEAEEAENRTNGTSCADQLPVTPPRRRRRLHRFPLLDLLRLFNVAPRNAFLRRKGGATRSKEGEANADDGPKPDTNPQPSSVQLPWFRREYDLRRFGFAMVLDFGWPSSQS